MSSITLRRLGRRDLARLGTAALALAAPAGTEAATTAVAGATRARYADEIAEWNGLIDAVRTAGEQLLSSAPSDNPVDRAEGLRYLARFLGRSITDAMAAAETLPMIRLNSSDISKAGLDASECRYTYSMLDRAGIYRLRGTIGSARYISLQLIGLVSAINDKVSGGQSINQFGLKPAPDGSFELMIAAERPKDWQGPWLRPSEHDNSIFTREYFDDWENTKPSKFYIERLDHASQRPLDPSAAGAIAQVIAKDFTSGLKQWNTTVAQIRSKAVNRILPPRSEHASGGQDELAYCQGAFKLQPGEALIVEMEAPDAHFWSAQLGNLWWESLDYANYLSSITAHYAVPSADGRYRLVIAQTDPGVVNWLDTAGHEDGTILFRFFLPKAVPQLHVRKVAQSELVAALPQDTQHVKPEQRAAAIAIRRRHVAARLAP